MTAVLAFGSGALLTILVAPLIGSTPISLRRAWDWSVPFGDNPDAQIFFIARLPRTLAGALVGWTVVPLALALARFRREDL